MIKYFVLIFSILILISGVTMFIIQVMPNHKEMTTKLRTNYVGVVQDIECGGGKNPVVTLTDGKKVSLSYPTVATGDSIFYHRTYGFFSQRNIGD